MPIETTKGGTSFTGNSVNTYRAEAQFGSISSGTMRSEDLIPAFASELQYLAPATATDHARLVQEANDLEDHEEEADDVLEALFDALNDYAPAYGYFGAHVGDGADYGFWLCEDFQQMIKDDGGLEVADTSEVPDDYTGEVLHVNDHGNATLYVADKGKLTEVWAVV